MLDRELVDETSVISKTNLVIRACNEYERIRYGCWGKNNVGIDAAIGEVLKMMGLE